MFYLKYRNENFFIVKNNKIIITSYEQYYEFLKEILKINESKDTNIELNGLKLNAKNTLIVDLSSIASATKIFNSENRLISEYIKTSLENYNIDYEKENSINLSINEIMKNLYKEVQIEEVEIDILKLVKSHTNFCINTNEDFFGVINEIVKSEDLKNIFVIYKKSILDFLKLNELEYIKSDKILLFEICDSNSKFKDDDNILFFDKDIYQITYNNLVDLILSKSKIRDLNRELFEFLLNNIFFYSINKKEVDIMRKHLKEIIIINDVLNKEFKINLMDTLDYI
ncbi:MAG: hypothetical protein ACLTKT_04795 [Clostridia bacterium]|nr:hypothetical protein [Clostridium sp.]